MMNNRPSPPTFNTRSSAASSQASEDASRGVDTSHDRSTAADSAQAPDLAVFVRDLLEQMESRFSQMGDSITGKMDHLGKRMDDLEQSVNELMDQAGLEPPPGNASSNQEERANQPNNNNGNETSLDTL